MSTCSRKAPLLAASVCPLLVRPYFPPPCHDQSRALPAFFPRRWPWPWLRRLCSATQRRCSSSATSTCLQSVELALSPRRRSAQPGQLHSRARRHTRARVAVLRAEPPARHPQARGLHAASTGSHSSVLRLARPYHIAGARSGTACSRRTCRTVRRWWPS